MRQKGCCKYIALVLSCYFGYTLFGYFYCDCYFISFFAAIPYRRRLKNSLIGSGLLVYIFIFIKLRAYIFYGYTLIGYGFSNLKSLGNRPIIIIRIGSNASVHQQLSGSNCPDTFII